MKIFYPATCCPDKPHLAKGLCSKHYEQERSKKRYKTRHSTPSRPGEGRIARNGYKYIRVNGRTALEHRVIMREKIGRSLSSLEQVHHLNGNKLDNRPENLELWSRSQPTGTRVKDLVMWAKEILKLYGGEEV